MALQVNIRSREQILGDLVRTLSINTDITAISQGSDIATLLEAISEAIFQSDVISLKILESLNIDNLVGIDLVKKARSIRLPDGQGGFGPIPAIRSTGPVVIGSSFDKISSTIYAGKPAPFAGSSIVFLKDASSFPSTGSVYLGRGTVDRFEGPIPYSSVVNNGSFWTLTLSSPLTKSHLFSDEVTVAQGGDRIIGSGTIVLIPANSDGPAVTFTTTQDLLIPDGESEGSVNVTCSQFGEVGNALSGSITQFSSLPFPGATVTNTRTFINGRSTESDEDLRQRIKNYPSTLSRGTSAAIRAALQGATDPDSGRSIQSTSILEPAQPGDYARVFIDDDTGLEPTFSNQPSEVLLQSAEGQETRFRTAQFPITPVLAEGSESAPFPLTQDMTITFTLDGIVETYQITPSNYENVNAATAYELVRDLNSQSNILGFRTLDGGTRIVAIDLSGTAESLKVAEGELQSIIGFPTADLRSLYLYKNSDLLSFRGTTATLQTRARNLWSLTTPDLQDVRVSVGGVIQTITITDSDFDVYGSNIANATVAQWAEVFSSKIAGVRFTASGQVIVWSTFDALSATGSLEILETKADGTPAGWIGDNKMWLTAESGGVLSSVGSDKEFNFNRFTGEIALLQKPQPNDKIEIATRQTYAFIESPDSSNGLFDLEPLVSVGNAKLIVGFDGVFAIREVSASATATLTPTQPDASGASHIIRLTSNDQSVFLNAIANDWLYILSDSTVVNPIPSSVEGLYKIRSAGFQLSDTNQTFTNLTGSTQNLSSISATVAKDSDQIVIFLADHGFKTGDLLTVSTSTSIGSIADTDLSVTDSQIFVLDKDTFYYVANDTSTIDGSGVLDDLGTNIITVSHSSHPFQTGSLADITVSSGFGGISAGDLSPSGAVIDVIDQNSYKYRALSASTTPASSQTVNSVELLADTWIEIEVSSVQFADWSPTLTNLYGVSADCVFVFRSDSTPQVIDFGVVTTLTVDQIVSSINSQIAAGIAEKSSPQSLILRSSSLKNDGSCAVLASIGSASNLFTEQVSLSRQAHTAFSPSEPIAGSFPVISSVELPTTQVLGYPTRTYLNVDRVITDVIDENTNPTIENKLSFTAEYPKGFQNLWITGNGYNYSARVYNNQTSAPYLGILNTSDIIRPIGTLDAEQTNPDTLDNYVNFGLRLQDVSFNNFDNFVLEMDLDPENKTISTPMYKIAKILDIDPIAGSGPGQVISFRLKDPDDSDLNFFAAGSVYKDFDFTDFKILTKSIGVYKDPLGSDIGLVLRSTDFGASHRLRFSARLPLEPDLSDIQILHENSYTGETDLNLIATLASGPLNAGTLLGSGQFKIVPSASGDIFEFRITSATLNQTLGYAAGEVLNIAGNSLVTGSYLILSSTYGTFNSVNASVSIGSDIVTVTIPGHGFVSGDLASIQASSPIGDIPAASMTFSAIEIVVVDPNTITFQALSTSTVNALGVIDNVQSGSVTVSSPFDAGITGSAIFSASQNPISSFPLAQKSWQDMADAINDYLSDSTPVATAEAIGTDPSSLDFETPTYYDYPVSPAYTGSDISGALTYHSFECNYSGSAGIWQYDSSDENLNEIKATVQTDDPIFPTSASVLPTPYSPIDEEIYIVPTNTKTISSWLSFKAASSLNILADVERIDNDTAVQISSKQDGGDGAVRVTGVNANSLFGSVIGNSTEVGDSTRISVLNSVSRSFLKDEIIQLRNTISSEILRSYRTVPTGSSITVANTVNTQNYFRNTNSLKYIKLGTNLGRLIVYRFGKGTGQSEPLDALNEITLTDLGNGLVQVTSDIASGPLGTGILSARVGDMMYINPDSSPFAVNNHCNPLPGSGITNGSNPEYLGYPVVHVIDEENIIVIAPNITTFGTTVLSDSKDLVFLPAIWNEKNIRTNHAAGAKFNELVNNNEAKYIIKTLGNGFVSVFLRNSSSEATDDMLLDTLSVVTDDLAVFGTEFDPANQGTFRIVAHNGRNHMVIYNPEGGRDQVFDAENIANGGSGERDWFGGKLTDGLRRSLRIISTDSVRIGDKLRISTPLDSGSQWFNDVFIGSWEITAIGIQSIDYTGDPLPHTTSSGTPTPGFEAVYIDFIIPNAPDAVLDDSSNPVDIFEIGANVFSIGFTEAEGYSCFRSVAGHSVSPLNTENREVFLVPKLNSQKFSQTFGTAVIATSKLGFAEQTLQGIDGYKAYSGLVRQAHRIIDGLPSNTITFPGVKAAGAIIEVQTPLIKSVEISLTVRPTDGVTLNNITDLIKSSVAGYINGLGVGQNVILSQIVRTVQSLPGVLSVAIEGTTPVANDNRIVVSDIEKAFVINTQTDIVVG